MKPKQREEEEDREVGTNVGDSGLDVLSPDKTTVVQILQLVDITREIFDACQFK